MSDLARALMVAIEVHAGQVDKQGEPYLWHVMRVVESVSPGARVVAALHDVAEDGGEEDRRLLLGLDLSRIEATALQLLSRETRTSYAGYIREIAYAAGGGQGLAQEVKLADLRDNLGRIPPEPPVESKAETALEIMTKEGHDEWLHNWSGLKRRYERAITVLESVEPVGAGADPYGRPDPSKHPEAWSE